MAIKNSAPKAMIIIHVVLNPPPDGDGEAVGGVVGGGLPVGGVNPVGGVDGGVVGGVVGGGVLVVGGVVGGVVEGGRLGGAPPRAKVTVPSDIPEKTTVFEFTF